MITYEPFFETLKVKGISTYRLINEYGFSKGTLDSLSEYYGTAEPPVRCGESHLSGLTEPPHFVY